MWGLKRQTCWSTIWLPSPSIALPFLFPMFLFFWYTLIPHFLHPCPCPDMQPVPNYFSPKSPLWLHQYPNLIFLTLLPRSPLPYMVLIVGYVGPVGFAKPVPKRFPKLPFNYLWSSDISHITLNHTWNSFIPFDTTCNTSQLFHPAIFHLSNFLYSVYFVEPQDPHVCFKNI